MFGWYRSRFRGCFWVFLKAELKFMKISLSKVPGGFRSCRGMINSRRMSKRLLMFWMPGQRDASGTSGVLGMMVMVAGEHYPVRSYEQRAPECWLAHQVRSDSATMDFS